MNYQNATNIFTSYGYLASFSYHLNKKVSPLIRGDT